MPFVRGTWMRGVALSALAAASLGVAGCSHVMHPLGGGKAVIAEFTDLRWITIEDPHQHYPF